MKVHVTKLLDTTMFVLDEMYKRDALPLLS